MTVGEVLTALGFGVAFGAIPALLGAGIVYTGWKRVGHGLTLIRSRPTDVANVENTEGRVEIEGEVVAADEILETPVDETRCVAYDYEVESYEYDQSQDDRRWETVESGEAVAPFLLDDGTGRLLVDPEEYDLWVSRGPPRQTDDSSIQLAELFDSLAHTAEGTRRRYVEGTIQRGDSVHVFGPTKDDSEATAMGADTATAVQATDDDIVHISDTGQWGTVGREFLSGVAIVLFGLPWLLVGIGLPTAMVGSTIGVF